YELLTGRPPFVGLTPQEVLAAHVTQAPEPVERHRPALAPALSQVVMRCIAKRAADRWQTAEELLTQLEPLTTPSGGTTPTGTQPIPAPAARANWGRAAAAVGLLGVFGVGVLLWRGRSLNLVELGRRTQVTLDPGLELDPALSPDRRFIAYVAGRPGRTNLFVRQVDGGLPIRVVTDQGEQRFPTWSPDGERLLFASTRGIEIVPALGGVPRGLIAAVYLESRRWPRRVPGRPDARRHPRRSAAPRHDRPQRPQHQRVGGRHATRVLGLHRDVERMVDPPLVDKRRFRLAGPAGHERKPDDRGLRYLSRWPVAGVRFQPE